MTDFAFAQLPHEAVDQTQSHIGFDAVAAQGGKPAQRKLTREEVALRYPPRPDPNWTPEREAAFFLSLPKDTKAKKPKPKSAWLVELYAKEVLGAKRVSVGYVSSLYSILSEFAAADKSGAEVRVSQRTEEHGTPQTIRTIQTQLREAGVLKKVVREQGHGFVGPVHIYEPEEPRPFRRATWADLEADRRSHERGTAAYSAHALSQTGITTVPF